MKNYWSKIFYETGITEANCRRSKQFLVVTAFFCFTVYFHSSLARFRIRMCSIFAARVHLCVVEVFVIVFSCYLVVICYCYQFLLSFKTLLCLYYYEHGVSTRAGGGGAWSLYILNNRQSVTT